MALLGRRRAWIRHQGRANAALMLLAREMSAEFVAPTRATNFAVVQGRTRGCSFELRVAAPPPDLLLTVRHYTAQATLRLDGPGCTVPHLDPAPMREAIEQACHQFATNH